MESVNGPDYPWALTPEQIDHLPWVALDRGLLAHLGIDRMRDRACRLAAEHGTEITMMHPGFSWLRVRALPPGGLGCGNPDCESCAAGVGPIWRAEVER